MKKTPARETAKGTATKAATGKATTKRAATKKAATKKASPPRTSARRPAAKGRPAAGGMHGPRADFGAPVDAFFDKQPPTLRPLVDGLRALVEEAAPDAQASLKWGMPFYSIGVGMKGMMCAIGAHKAHVNLILPGPPGTYADPDGRLSGSGAPGRHLQLRPGDEIPRKLVRGWLKIAAARARAQG